MFNENSTLKEILETEHGKKVLAENGVPCLSCAMASQEIDVLKVGDVADMYGLDKDKIIKELNGESK